MKNFIKRSEMKVVLGGGYKIGPGDIYEDYGVQEYGVIEPEYGVDCPCVNKN